jgi:TM2 domain-containing membrane protein YozV
MPVISGLAIVAVLLIILGLIRLYRGQKVEGTIELFGGLISFISEIFPALIEIVGEILAAFL